MSKVALEEVESVLLQHKVQDTQNIITDLMKIIEELKADRDSNPRPKWRHVIVLKDTDGSLAGKELVGWVTQVEEGTDEGTVLSRITDAVKTSNENAKRRKSLITDMVEAFAHLKPKWLKEKKVKIKTKEETRVLISNGKLV